MEYKIIWLLLSLAFVCCFLFRKFLFGYKDSDYVGVYVILNQEYSNIAPGEFALRIEGVITEFKTIGNNVQFTVVELDEEEEQSSKTHKFLLNKEEDGGCIMIHSTVLQLGEQYLCFDIEEAERALL